MATHKYTPEQQIIAFWNKVNKDGSIPLHCPELGACWEWKASLINGYGQVNWSGITARSHRFSWELHNGKIPNGLWVLHKCDNHACVNPDHLFLGTPKDNTNDMYKKGREKIVKGQAHYKAQLTDEEVIEIRRRYAIGGITQQELSFEYGVWVRTITAIVQRKSWKHLTP